MREDGRLWNDLRTVWNDRPSDPWFMFAAVEVVHEQSGQVGFMTNVALGVVVDENKKLLDACGRLPLPF